MLRAEAEDVEPQAFCFCWCPGQMRSEYPRAVLLSVCLVEAQAPRFSFQWADPFARPRDKAGFRGKRRNLFQIMNTKSSTMSDLTRRAKLVAQPRSGSVLATEAMKMKRLLLVVAALGGLFSAGHPAFAQSNSTLYTVLTAVPNHSAEAAARLNPFRSRRADPLRRRWSYLQRHCRHHPESPPRQNRA